MSFWVWQESCGPELVLGVWSLIFPSPQAPGCPEWPVLGVLESTSALRVHFWISFLWNTLNSVYSHHSLWQHLAEILYQAFEMVFLNSDWATCCFNEALPGFDEPLPVSLCGQGGTGLLGTLISAGKESTDSHCDVIAAVSWWLGCNLSSWSLISKSSLDVSLTFSLLPLLSWTEEWCRVSMIPCFLFFQQRDNYAADE